MWRPSSCCPGRSSIASLHTITGSRFFGFWEMIVYLGFVVVGFFYIIKKGILDWAADRGDL